MATRAEIIAEARTWLKTPWRHQGRLKGIGCDCVGHIVCVPRALGIFPPIR
jgi:cell wall-associated NlpC family hydrolase